MYKVLIPQDINACGKEYLQQKGFNVVLGSGSDTATIKREVADCDALIVRTALYTADVIDAGKKLKIIARCGVGTDNIDVEAAERHGVYVTIAKNANVESVAEHAIALLLATSKNLVHCDEAIRRGNWEIRNNLPGTELHGKTLGIIGLGAIGSATAMKAHFGLGMNIIGYDPYPLQSKPDYITILNSMEEVFVNADAVSLHIPLTPETRNIVSKRILKLMKPSAYLINCSRGGIVDEGDLYNALVNKVIKGAALDVFSEEPPKVDNKLFLLSNLIVSPHNAGLTKEAADAMSMSCARAVEAVFSGRVPKYAVNDPKRA